MIQFNIGDRLRYTDTGIEYGIVGMTDDKLMLSCHESLNSHPSHFPKQDILKNIASGYMIHMSGPSASGQGSPCNNCA